jgi:putative ABC transport system permease protein
MVAQVFAWDYNPEPADLRRFFDTTLQRLQALPAVQHAGAVSAMPFIEANINISAAFAIKGRPQPAEGEAPRAFLSIATPGYFDAMRIPLLAGRGLQRHDGPDSKPVAVISETLARRYWPTVPAAVGETMRFRFAGNPTEVEVVGVVGALRHDSLDRAPRDEVFMPLAQKPYGSMTFVVASAADATALLEPVRSAIWAVNPQQTIYRSVTLDELVANTITPRRFTLSVMIAFAAVSLLLAVAGVYSVLSAIITSRAREVGLRVALGASRADIVLLVLGRGIAMASAGLILGIAGSFGAAQLLRSFLFGITPTDPLAMTSAALVMTLAAIAACYFPARRAATSDPIAVLRTD